MPGKWTHVAMNGDKRNIVSLDDVESFYEAYAKRHDSGYDQFWVEQVSYPLFNMFVDLDMPYHMTVEDLKSISERAYSTLQTDLLCSTSGSTDTKTGLHIQTRKAVTREEAEAIADLLSADSVPHVDKAVYSTGLRMIGSKKCKNKKITGPSYYPIGVFGDSGWRDPPTLLECITLFSIRIPCQKICEDTGSSSEIVPFKLTEFVRDVFPKQKDTTLTMWSKQGKDVYSIMSDSRFCENVNRNHTSNHVYFVLARAPTGRFRMYQKCHCPKDNCIGFKGTPRVLFRDVENDIKNSLPV